MNCRSFDVELATVSVDMLASLCQNETGMLLINRSQHIQEFLIENTVYMQKKRDLLTFLATSSLAEAILYDFLLQKIKQSSKSILVQEFAQSTVAGESI